MMCGETKRAKTTVEGTCPKCGGLNIIFVDGPNSADDQIFYNATCQDCLCKYKEWYSVQYLESEENENITIVRITKEQSEQLQHDLISMMGLDPDVYSEELVDILCQAVVDYQKG